MYNEDIKIKFIEQVLKTESRKEVAYRMFRTIEKEEEAKNADVCTWELEDLQKLVDNITSIRTNGKSSRISILNKYALWCVENNFPNSNTLILNVNKLGLSKIKKEMVANPQHLKRWLDYVFENENENTIDNTYRAAYWLSYIGIKENDILKVRDSDVDLDSATIIHNNKEYYIYKEGMEAIRTCVELKQFKYKHKLYTTYRDRADGHEILRGIKPKSAIKQITKLIYRKRKEAVQGRENTNEFLNIEPSLYDVWWSGIFYRTYELEMAGVKPDFTKMAKEHILGLESIKDKPNKYINNRITQEKHLFLTDYNNWKMAYAVKN